MQPLPVSRPFQHIEPPPSLRRPRKFRAPPHKVVVEPAPSHGGAPTYAAYETRLTLLPADPDSLDAYSNSPPSGVQDAEKHRPSFGIRIYDITPSATAERAALLVRRISEQTYSVRMSSNGHPHDRIEVVALSMPADTSTAKARVEKCIAYNEAERAARLLISNPAVAKSWFIPADFRGLGSRKRLFIIVDLQEGWENALASRECVSWYPSATDKYGRFYQISYDRYWDEEYWWELEEPGSSVPHGEPLGNVGSDLNEGRLDMHTFHDCHFIPRSILDMELVLARAEVAGIKVPRPVMIRLRL